MRNPRISLSFKDIDSIKYHVMKFRRKTLIVKSTLVLMPLFGSGALTTHAQHHAPYAAQTYLAEITSFDLYCSETDGPVKHTTLPQWFLAAANLRGLSLTGYSPWDKLIPPAESNPAAETAIPVGVAESASLPLLIPRTPADKVISETIREVTAYNVGDPSQNDSDPCIAASGENICAALTAGAKRCAANFVALGTRLDIENFGICTVTDRMNARYRNRVDVAMELWEKRKAIEFGLQKLRVKILKSR